MNKYNKKELNKAVAKAIDKGYIQKGIYTSLLFISEDSQNNDGYIEAKRFGYNRNTDSLDYLGTTDIMPFEGIDISYKDYQMDFIPNGIQLFRRDKEEFKVDASYYSSTIIFKTLKYVLDRQKRLWMNKKYLNKLENY